MKITAIVPIKHESTRVPGKNYRLMNGSPLYYYVLQTLSKSAYINEIIVDTNSPVIIENVPKQFPNIKIYQRPDHLCGNSVSTNQLLMNIIQDLDLQSDLYLQTHVTNPLLSTNTIDKAVEAFLSQQDRYDSLFTVKTLHTRLYDKTGKDINHNRFHLIPTQDLDPIYEENSCLYLFTKEILFMHKSRIGPNALLYSMSDIESQDIDWEDDFVLTELMMRLHTNTHNI